MMPNTMARIRKVSVSPRFSSILLTTGESTITEAPKKNTVIPVIRPFLSANHFCRA